MTAVDSTRLGAIYARGDDPWRFRSSPYEQEKFRATRAALSRQRYGSALELGCGNGELARHLAPLCAQYTGVDAVEIALQAARRAVPRGRFEQVFLPADLPDGRYDLIILSEILYFLDRDGIRSIATQIDRRWPRACLLCVTWLGPSGNALQGAEALALFRAASMRELHCVKTGVPYRIDRTDVLP
ncbi:methyltransferase [Salipiger aestuarii]|uniref:Nodulation protein S (NodS) n=1 Tax=Salipiger aestuarii TaxID=568098 RepID=A0A327XLW3_9RHOB|nr:class I SAM-dependent methyltransferase [Salipiger aestuarii]EIE49389.1 NodS [Citreicella sp. 357]KAA8607794.1 methyltransferase [Salipiger aestuarii]KAA8607956.1 methyltransferase [Salipiger aestuarii]KAB2534809.1 methyltransferase [Salipiger aestuarii]RAK09017.1 nodulation protein S (NodS) [Salipiger aestuarii]